VLPIMTVCVSARSRYGHKISKDPGFQSNFNSLKYVSNDENRFDTSSRNRPTRKILPAKIAWSIRPKMGMSIAGGDLQRALAFASAAWTTSLNSVVLSAPPCRRRRNKKPGDSSPATVAMASRFKIYKTKTAIKAHSTLQNFRNDTAAPIPTDSKAVFKSAE
jgi:hypothetical protein